MILSAAVCASSMADCSDWFSVLVCFATGGVRLGCVEGASVDLLSSSDLLDMFEACEEMTELAAACEQIICYGNVTAFWREESPCCI